MTSAEAERLAAIVEATREMRRCQRRYFDTRGLDWLKKAKAAEALVDRMIRENDTESANEAQGRLA